MSCLDVVAQLEVTARAWVASQDRGTLHRAGAPAISTNLARFEKFTSLHFQCAILCAVSSLNTYELSKPHWHVALAQASERGDRPSLSCSTSFLIDPPVTLGSFFSSYSLQLSTGFAWSLSLVAQKMNRQHQ